MAFGDSGAGGGTLNGPRRFSATVASPAVARWLGDDRPVRLLHASDEIATFVDDWGVVVSWVAEDRGLGPFAAVVPERGARLTQDGARAARVAGGRLIVGGDEVDITGASLWDPVLRWRAGSLERLLSWAAGAVEGDRASVLELSVALQAGDRQRAEAVVLALAGRGPGLTPEGDDSIAGVLLAAWSTQDQNRHLVEQLANLAAARTTTLSAAWLRAAGRGEAAWVWHQLAAAVAEPTADPGSAWRGVLGWGASSGRAMWLGFSAYLESLPRRNDEQGKLLRTATFDRGRA